nr:uncharacterized protein LOC122269374 [Parasteatoda tepidariorum]
MVRKYVRRRVGEALHPDCIEATTKDPTNVMIWACMSADGVCRIQVIGGILNAKKYIETVLKPKVIPSIRDLLPNSAPFIFQRDSAQCHTTNFQIRPDKDMDEEDKMDPEYLHSRCVTCRRRILDGEKVICPFNRCNVCQGGICEDCVYKGTGDLRWMCGCCHRKRKERARTSSAQPDNWFFDLNETFDSLNAPTRSRETCSTETTESHLNDSGANKCPSEGMESQRAYATNDHANQISESSQSSSSSNAARESMKKAIKPSEYHLEVVHLSGSPSQRRHMTNKPTNCDKSVTHSDYKNPQSKKDYPAQDKSQSHHEKVDSPKNKTDNVHQPRKVDTGAKNKREKNESGKETETFIEYFRYHFLSSNYRKDKAQSNNSHPHPNLKETQISNNEIQGNSKPSIPKNKEKVPPLYSDSLRVDLPPPYFSDLSYKRVEQEHQARNKDTSISPEHQRPPPEYYQDTPNMKQRLEKHDLRGRPLERGRQIKGAPERNSSLECHTERRDSHRQHVSRIDTIPHGSKKLPSDGWDNGTVAERKSRSTSLGRPQMNLPQERERGYSVDEMRYGERNVGKRQPRLERQNTSMDYYWEQPHQRKDHHAPLRPNLDDDNEFEKALCSFRNFDYDFEPESFSELDICAQNPRRYMYDEDRHYSDRASGEYSKQ